MPQDDTTRESGGCVCGAVRFETVGNPQRITVCHCLWCQRRTGSAFGVEVVFPLSDIHFSGVAVAKYRHRSDESNRWLDMFFCPECGTNLGITLEVRRDVRTVPAGAYDQPEWLDRSGAEIRHVYTRSKRHWGNLSDELKTYEAYFE